MSDQPMPERGPGEIQRFLQDARAELASLDVKLQEAHDALAGAEERWQEHLDDTIAALEEDVAADRISRLPGEDVRVSLARRTGDGREVWNTYRRAHRMVAKWEQRLRLLDKQISAAQSEGKLMGVA